MAKGSFILFHNQLPYFCGQTDENAGKLIKAVMIYAVTGEIPDLPGPLAMLFSWIKDSLDENAVKYAAKCESAAAARAAREAKAAAPTETELNQY